MIDDKTIVVFDVDGTLTKSRLKIEPPMIDMLNKLKKKVEIAFVGGSDFNKQIEQVGMDVLKLFKYWFPQNGLKAYKDEKSIAVQSFIGFYGEEKMKKLINFVLRYFSELELPVKRGTFIEWRECMINVSPIGRACSQTERDAFFELDKKEKFRVTLCEVMEKEFPELAFVIGGQISIDIFPKGWDKTYCLKYLKQDGFETIYFFGDKTWKGGNDHEIFAHPDTKGYTVKNPQETIKILNDLFFKNE